MKRLIVVAAFVACSSHEKEDKQRECDQIAADIREAARVRNIPSQGACTNPSADQDLKNACDRLTKCNQEAAAL